MRNLRRVFLVMASFALVTFSGTGDVSATCLVFPETIFIGQDFVIRWSTPADVAFIKGDLSHIGSYSTQMRTSYASTNMIDTSPDVPPLGHGYFYLTKPSEPPCSSWQNVEGAEPGRDLLILQRCSVVQPSDTQMDQAADVAVAGLASPFGNNEEFLLMLRRYQEILGCAVDTGPATLAVTQLFTSQTDCEREYCSNLGYCGPGTQRGGTAVRPGDCLNRKCFDHDSCYREHCVPSDLFCYFSPLTREIGCDAPLVEACDTCKAAAGSGWSHIDEGVCRAVRALNRRTGGCSTPFCPLQDCDASTGRCANVCLGALFQEGFEDGLQKWPTVISMFLADSTSVRGTHSASFARTGSGGDGASILVGVTPGLTYELQVAYRTDGGGGFIGVEKYDVRQRVVGVENWLIGDGSDVTYDNQSWDCNVTTCNAEDVGVWRRYSQRYTVPVGVYYLSVLVEEFVGGLPFSPVYFDEVQWCPIVGF